MYTSRTLMSRTRGGNGPFHTHIMSSLGTSSRKLYRKGVMFTTVASLLLVSGGILTYLGFTQVFGGSVSMTGPLVMALAVLLFLCSIRQFMVARKMRQADHRLQVQISNNGVGAMVIERDDAVGTVTVVVDTVNTEPHRCRRRSTENVAPPDYSEATSDFYPESVVCSETTDPPPPYGPPSYEEVVARDINSPGDRPEHIVSAAESESVLPSSTSSDQCITECSEEQKNLNYQDLPTVTI